MNTSHLGLSLIKQCEGLCLSKYADHGHWAIGYGHDLLPGEDYPRGITEDHAVSLLAQDVLKVEGALQHLAPQANQNQFDALIDFGFNLGIRSLAKMLMHGFDQAPVQMLRWNHVDGFVNEPVAARRRAEVALFQTRIVAPLTTA